MDLGIDGKVALVTGATAGIGRATAKMLAAEGARLRIRWEATILHADQVRSSRRGGSVRICAMGSPSSRIHSVRSSYPIAVVAVVLLSLPGFGPVLAATFLADIGGNLDGFDTVDRLAAVAGLAPVR